MKVFLISLLLISTVAPGCSRRAASQAGLSIKNNQQDTAPKPALQDQINEAASQAKGHVGLIAIVLESGETIASLNSHDHFPMQSVYKLPISMAVMKAVDAGKIKLSDRVSITKSDMVGSAAYSPIRDKYPQGTSLTVADLLRYALVESDGTASDVLMRVSGGAAAVQSYLGDLGISEIKVVDTENAMSQDHSVQYRNYATPEAAVALLRALDERRGLSEASQALLLKLMMDSRPGAKRLKGLLPVGTAIAHKTGTSGTENGMTAATNDIGIITLPNGKHLAIAVFVSDSTADEVTREGVIAKIAKAVWDALAGKNEAAK